MMKYIFLILAFIVLLEILCSTGNIAAVLLIIFLIIAVIATHQIIKKQAKSSAPKTNEPVEQSSPDDEIKLCEIHLSETAHERNDLDQMPDVHFNNVTKRTDQDKLGTFVSLDLETTGLNPERDRILEISAVRFIGWKPSECFHTYVNPKIRIPKKASETNGITSEMVSEAPEFYQIIDSLNQFINKDNIVGHNLIFDLQFLFCSGYDFTSVKSRKYYDTLSIVKYVLSKDSKHWNADEGCYEYDNDKIDVDNYKLTTLCEYYGIRDNLNAHHAFSDSLATGKLFWNLVDDKLSKTN